MTPDVRGDRCELSPIGWWCSRPVGHDGPCAARQESLGFGLRLRLRWWGFRDWLHRCPDCGRRGYSTLSPRWEDDPVAQMLGAVTEARCRGCGKEDR